MSRKRQYDPDTTLLTELGDRVPSRVAAVGWARDAVTEGNVYTVATAMAVALRIDDSLVCWPRIALLCKDIRASDKSVRRASVQLQEQRVIAVLYLWRGEEPSGCVWVMNLDGWLDDVFDDRPALLRRVVAVREHAMRLQMHAQPLPAGTELSARRPANQHRRT